MTAEKLIDTGHVSCPYRDKPIVIMQTKPKAITLEEFRQKVRDSLEADKKREKAKKA